MPTKQRLLSSYSKRIKELEYELELVRLPLAILTSSLGIHNNTMKEIVSEWNSMLEKEIK